MGSNRANSEGNNRLEWANGRTPIEFITGDTPDVSEYIDLEPVIG